MKLEDDRTEEQKQTHPVIVMMTDSFLSGWGEAKNSPSYAGWACKIEDADRVERWVRNRGEARRVRIVSADYRPRGAGHCHIYVVNEGHASLR